MIAWLNVKIYLRIHLGICLFPLSVIGRHVHVKVVPSKGNPGDAFQEDKADRLLECVYQCIGIQDCKSVSFNKTVGLCKLYSSIFSMDRELGSPLMYASLSRAPVISKINYNNQTSSRRAAGKSTSLPVTEQTVKRPRLVSGRMTYKQAEKECTEVHSQLLIIRSGENQAEAVKIVNDSNLNLIGIGLHKCGLSWCYSDRKSITYTAWAPGASIGLFGVLSKEMHYMWDTVMYHHIIDGYICER